MDGIRRHEMLWLLCVLCLAIVWAPVNLLLPGSWWAGLICTGASYVVSRVVLWLIP